MSDYKNAGGGLQDQGRKTLAVTPGAVDLPSIAKGIMVLTAGDLTVIPVDNADAETVAFTGLFAGQFIPLVVRRVTAATATVVAVIG